MNILFLGGGNWYPAIIANNAVWPDVFDLLADTVLKPSPLLLL